MFFYNSEKISVDFRILRFSIFQICVVTQTFRKDITGQEEWSSRDLPLRGEKRPCMLENILE